MRERDIEAHLVARVKELGGEVRKVKWIGRRGAPDRVVMLPRVETKVRTHLGGSRLHEVRPPVTLWVELKATGEVPEPHQVREHIRMRKMGQRVEVIDSIEGVEALLR